MLTQEMIALKLNKKNLKKKIQGFTNKKNVNFNNNQNFDIKNSNVENVYKREKRIRFTFLFLKSRRGHNFTKRRNVTFFQRTRLNSSFN